MLNIPRLKKITALQKAVDFLGFLVFIPFFCALSFQLYCSSIPPLVGWGALVVSAILGLVIADVISGIVHWLADRYGHVDTPFFGEQFILPFRAHHLYPEDMTKLGFVVNNGNSCLLAGIFLAFVVFVLPPIESSFSLFLIGATGLFFSLFAGITNLFHMWAHSKTVPAWVRWLQVRRLILSPKHHEVHHTSPYAQHYCITCGWINGWLDRIRFFERLEKIIFQIFGVRGGDYDLQEINKRHQQSLKNLSND
jgi:ubiquitin-conjugating enzyme E2 variant